MATPRKRPLVLVVEDDPALGDVMLTALKDDGLDAKLAHDGDEAMRDVDDLSPAVMVLDLMMPKRDGFSVLRELCGVLCLRLQRLNDSCAKRLRRSAYEGAGRARVAARSAAPAPSLSSKQ